MRKTKRSTKYMQLDKICLGEYEAVSARLTTAGAKNMKVRTVNKTRDS